MVNKAIEYIRKYFSDWTWWEIAWLWLSTTTILTFSFIWKDTWIGIVASVSGLWTVLLTAKAKISSFYVGIINLIFYAYVAYGKQLYGEVILNLAYYLPMTFVAIAVWKKNIVSKDKPDDVIVTALSNKARLIWLVVCVASVYGFGIFLKAINSNMPFINSATVVLSVIAMILLTKRYMEQWLIWVVVDVMTVGMWFVVMRQGGNDISILVMWLAWLINAVYGLVNWLRMLPKTNRAKLS